MEAEHDQRLWDTFIAGIEAPREQLVIDIRDGRRNRAYLRSVWERPLQLPKPGRTSKRVFDVVISAVSLVILAPVFVAVAILVRSSSPGPAIFRQERVGLNGALFTCFKFRTMDADAEERFVDMISDNEHFRRGLQRDQKPGKDPRITRVGAVLRNFSIDELPQLLNVVLGEMSFVGPRPILPHEAARFGPALSIITSVKPGLTGLWQISGRSELVFEERVQLDVTYAETATMIDDLRISLRTVRAVLMSQGAK